MKPSVGLMLPVLALLGFIAAIVATIVGDYGGFYFTLDDPYIHLSVAQNIVDHGVYGINSAEPASPSSSILWPFLLVPLEALQIGPIGTLLLNVLLALVAVVLSCRIVARQNDGVLGGIVVASWFLGCNLVGLVFTGMEHVAQIAVVTAAAYGALATLDSGRAPRWLWAVLLLGPFIRYENMAVSVPLLAWLFLRGERRGAIGTGVLIGLGLATFSAVLVLNDMSVLPSSVVAKSVHVKENGLWAPVANFLFNVMEWGGGVVLFFGIMLFGISRDKPDEGLSDRGKLAIAAAATAILHLTFGRNGWFHRYEVYAIAYTSVMLIGLWPRRYEGKDRVKFGVAAAVVLLGVSWQYTLTLRQVPAAAGNIYSQQFQLHRLATELQVPIGVTDLGWPSYRNPHYIYDFYGLGNYDATEHRLAGEGVEWMAEATRDAKLEFVMLSTVWFDDEVPATWTPMGALCVTMEQVTLKDPEVRFFAVGPATDKLRSGIARWAEGLPATAKFVNGRCSDVEE